MWPWKRRPPRVLTERERLVRSQAAFRVACSAAALQLLNELKGYEDVEGWGTDLPVDSNKPYLTYGGRCFNPLHRDLQSLEELVRFTDDLHSGLLDRVRAEVHRRELASARAREDVERGLCVVRQVLGRPDHRELLRPVGATEE